MLKEIFLMAAYNLSHRKLRTSLTILGVVIGVAAIVGLVGAAQGINKMIIQQVEKFQSDIISIIPGEFKMGFMGFGDFGAEKVAKLGERDVEEIKKIAGVRIAGGEVSKKFTVEFNDEKFSLSVFGADPEVLREVNTIGIFEGRDLDSGDTQSAVIGYSVAMDLFEKDIDLKKKILIDGKEFRVVGILNKAGGFFQTFDSIIYIPKDTMRDLFVLDKEEVSSIHVKVEEGYDPIRVAHAIEEELVKFRKVSEKNDFTVISPEFSQKISEQILSLMQILLGGIAGISLVVGSIGISNMMFTSVLERTREIGIMKAVGAKSRHIMLLFLIESGIIGLIGGLIGIVVGYGLGEGFLYARQILIAQTEFAVSTEMPHVLLTPELIILSLFISCAVGILAGFLPARRAARLQPVEALRYE